LSTHRQAWPHCDYAIRSVGWNLRWRIQEETQPVRVYTYDGQAIDADHLKITASDIHELTWIA